MSARFPGSAGYNQTDATGVLFSSGGAMAAKRFSTGAAVTVQPWAAFLCWVRPFVFRRWWLIWGRGLSTLSSRRRDRKLCVRLQSVILTLCNGIRILRKHGSEGGCAVMDPQAPASHTYDQDVVRLKEMFAKSGMSFRKISKGGRGTDKLKINAPPLKTGSHVVLYIMGDASCKDQWGGGVMVSGEQGTCYLKAQFVFEAWGLSSKLIEATMVVAALVAIDEWVRRVVYERDVVVEVWAWSDNLSAIRQLVEESLGEVGWI